MVLDEGLAWNGLNEFDTPVRVNMSQLTVPTLSTIQNYSVDETTTEEMGNVSLTTVSDVDACVSEVPKHDFIGVKFAFLSVIGSAVALFGIFGNLTTFVVMRRPVMRRSSNHLYLAALAIFDTLLLFPSIMLYSMEPVSEYFDLPDMYVIWIQWVPHCFALSHFAQTGSVYITVSATFERYLAVLYPTAAEVQCTKHRTALTILGVTCFAGVFNCTKYFEIIVAHYENCTGFTAYELIPSALLQHRIYSMVYTLWLSQFVMVFLPFGVLLAVNTAIVWAFRHSLKQVKSWEDRCRRISVKRFDGSEILLERAALKEQSRDATRVLATIVGVFLVCNSLGFIVTLMESVYSPGQLAEWSPTLYAFSRDAINFLAIVNSSINFVVCCTFGEDFRCELSAICGYTAQRRRLLSRRRRQFGAKKSSENGEKLRNTENKPVVGRTECEPDERSPLQQMTELQGAISGYYKACNGKESIFAMVL